MSDHEVWPGAPGDWPAADPGPAVATAVAALLDPGRTEELGTTVGLQVVVGGRRVVDHAVDPARRRISWSMAKTLTAALVGVAVGQGRCDVESPLGFPEWADDERSMLRVRHLLEMRSGLDFTEAYVETDGAPTPDVIEMLFGAGKDDVAAYAAARPLAHEPGTHWSYSSGETNLLCRFLRDLLGGPDAFDRWAHEHLLDPIDAPGMELRTDAAGTFVGSSFGYGTAEEHARFGLLLVRDGCWRDRRVLPEGWVASMRTPQATDPETGQGYGWQTWTPAHGRHGVFSANGYDGQWTLCSPDLDAVVLRLGTGSEPVKEAARLAVDSVMDAVAAG